MKNNDGTRQEMKHRYKQNTDMNRTQQWNKMRNETQTYKEHINGKR